MNRSIALALVVLSLPLVGCAEVGVLSSGASSDYYVDCRTTTLDARGSRLTGEVFLEEIRSRARGKA